MKRGILFSALFLLVAVACVQEVQTDQRDDRAPVDLVEPLVDAANSRWFFFNSATLPFGMVNLSPDMVIDGAWNSGYRYNQDTIRCFSHIHAWQLSGVPVLPTIGKFKGHLGPDIYGSHYTHDQETVRPGYHQIFLQDYQIDAELTSTTRVGFHRYTFPESDESHIHVDLSMHLGPCDTKSGMIRKTSDRSLEGYALMAATRRRPKDTYVYFAVEFDQDVDQFGTWQDGKVLSQEEIEGVRTGGYVSFSTRQGEQRLMKVAISYTSIDQAKLNLRSELAHWDFDRTVQESRTIWNRWLSRIEVEGGTRIQQSRFYTDLWHALQGRRIISDVDGKYCDMTGREPRIGQIPLDQNGVPRFKHYNSDSFWGAQWTLNSLWHLVYPKVTEEFVNSMLMMYEDGGLIPRGPSGGNYTYVMTGASTTPFIVSAYMKGIRGFDIESAYSALVKNHSAAGIMAKAGYEHSTWSGGGMEYYLKNGFIPYPLDRPAKGFHEDGSGQTLEYAFQDWTLSQLSSALGHQDDAREFANRAQNYRNIWRADKASMWLRNLDGSWKENVDVLSYGDGWVEGNASQYSWWVPHDVAGLIQLTGDRQQFTNRLNTVFEGGIGHDFTAAKSHDAGETRENRRVHINYGNQPCMHMAYLFNYSGAPWLTQYWSRQVINAVYSDLSPQFGYSGDEDQGLMGALAVLMKIGLFELRGGAAENPIYEIGSPIFEKVTIALDPEYYSGGSFSIIADGTSERNVYVQEATLDGQPLSKPWFYHGALVDGGSLTLQMGPKPNKNWGSDEDDAPPSMSTE